MGKIPVRQTIKALDSMSFASEATDLFQRIVTSNVVKGPNQLPTKPLDRLCYRETVTIHINKYYIN